ncbi:MAG TPA: hypothetical protein VMU63_10990 [Acidimicrobiales bacterium]|nr:hypothetical protein [Acidimicrobiales bacterium]
MRWVPLSAVAIGTAGALVVAAAPWGSGAVPYGSGSAVESGPAVIPHFVVPEGYHVVYRVTAQGLSPYTEQVWVDRPFDSVDQTLSGPPPGGPVDLATVSRLGAEVLTTGDSEPALIHVPVMMGARDVRLDAVINSALNGGFLRYQGTSTVLGRRCWNYRSAQSLAATGAMAELSGTANYVISCVGADGVVLAEATYKNTHLTQLRQAVELSTGPAAGGGGDYQMAAAATPFDEGGGSFQALTLSSSPPGLSWVATWVPPGFIHHGRYAVIPSQPQLFDQTSGQQPNPLGLPNGLVTEMDDAYLSGPNVIVVQQGVTAGNSVFKAPTGGVNIALGPVMGTGQLMLSATASFVSAEPDGGSHFVRVSGTVSPAELVRVARSLEKENPGRLVQLNGG